MDGGSTRSTVLVVDDEQAIRLLCRVNLELEGYDVLEAGTLDEARERLGAGGVDVLLLDLHLGGERAYGLIAECSARTPRVPVAVVSGSADLTEAERAGAAAVLAKPFEIDALTATVRSLAAGGAAAG